MDKRLCVYTCITGDCDNLHEIKHPEKNIDYLCFTNNKKLNSNTWKIIQIENNGLDDHRLSRKIKMLGHSIISENYNISVWMDASVVWQKDISDFVVKYLKNNLFAAFKHSQRDTVQKEAIACLRFRKDTKENITHTLDFLKSEHFPDNLGLYEMTVFAKRHNNPTVKKTMELWFNINQKYSKRDQLSFMYAIWKTGLKIAPINLNVWDNPWFRTITHIKKPSIRQCHIYYGNFNRNFSFDKYQVYNYKKANSHYSIVCSIPQDITEIEISPIDDINILYKNLTIIPRPKHIILPNTIRYDDGNLLYIEHDVFYINGDFKKGQQLSISFDARILNQSELYQIIQQLESQKLTLQNSTNQLKVQKSELLNKNQQLNQELSKLQTQYQAILNSKSWKAIRKVRSLFPPYH